jgi:predicted RNase H-like HicB family nuclease
MSPTIDVTVEKNVEYYIGLRYQWVITPDEEGFGVKIVGLPGCITHALKWEDIPARVHDAMVSWIATSLEYGDPIAEPAQIPEI